MYGEDNRCTSCGEHIADPHAPSCRNICGVCGNFGVISRQVGTEVRPGVHTYEQREVPCPRCTPWRAA